MFWYITLLFFKDDKPHSKCQVKIKMCSKTLNQGWPSFIRLPYTLIHLASHEKGLVPLPFTAISIRTEHYQASHNGVGFIWGWLQDGCRIAKDTLDQQICTVIHRCSYVTTHHFNVLCWYSSGPMSHAFLIRSMSIQWRPEVVSSASIDTAHWISKWIQRNQDNSLYRRG